jgi:uncharacterized phage protein (TIGR02218 family)
MRTLPAGLSSALTSGDTTNLCRLFKMTRVDGRVFYLTDYHQALTVDGQEYLPAIGVQVGALQMRANEAAGALTMNVAATGDSLATVATTLAGITSTYGAVASDPITSDIVTYFYQQILGRSPDAAGLAYWTGQSLTVEELLDEFVHSQEYIAAFGLIDHGRLVRGAYDNAEVWFYVADHNTPANGKLAIWRGYVNAVTVSEDGAATIEVLGLLSKARFLLTENYSPVCRAYLGDDRCGVDLTPYIHDAVVVSTSGYDVVLTVTGTPVHTFELGSIVGVTGANKGKAIEIKSWVSSPATATLFLQPELAFAVGDQVQLVPGCDYTTGANGCTKWANILNFRGEPFAVGDVNYNAWPGA